MRLIGVLGLLLALSIVTFSVSQGQAANLNLFDAVQANDEEAVATLLTQGADINAAQLDGSTPLAWAAARGNAKLAALLIRKGAKVNAANENGETPLTLACGLGSVPVAKLLLEAGAEVTADTWSGETALFRAVDANHPEPVRLLIDKGAQVNRAEKRLGQTPLMWAAAEGRTEIVETLLKAGADVAAKSTNGYTALLLASQKGDLATARALIAASADAVYQAPDGATPFLVALSRGHESVARLMLENGADVNTADKNGSTPLHEAVRQGKVELVRDLVSRGANLHARTPPTPGRLSYFRPGEMTPFLIAAQSGDVTMMRELVTLGANPKDHGQNGLTGLLLASGSRKLEAVKLMFEYGADANEGPEGRSPLHTAIRFGSNDIIELLVEKGADLYAKDVFGRTPLEEAEFEAPKPTIELLQKLTAANPQPAKN